MDPRSCHMGFFSVVPSDKNYVPWSRFSLWKWVPGISLGVKVAGAFGWWPTTPVAPKVEKIRGLNLPGTPRATSACHGIPFNILWRGQSMNLTYLKISSFIWYLRRVTLARGIHKNILQKENIRYDFHNRCISIWMHLSHAVLLEQLFIENLIHLKTLHTCIEEYNV